MLRFKRGSVEPIQEKRIFGILTADQVGYVPNIKVNFTESSDTFCQDTYKFQSMKAMQVGNQIESFVNVDLIKEHKKEKIVNEYVPEEDDLFPFQVDNICTV